MSGSTERGQDYDRDVRAGKTDDVKVPVSEERLNVDKRPAEQGEVQLHKTVTEEQQTVPVELEREEVQVRRQDIGDRPLRPGEEAVANKEAVVTGEVNVHKHQQTERQEVADTVRKERVEVDKDYDQHRSGFQQHFEGRQGQMQGGQSSSRSWEEAEPNYQYGYSAGGNQQYQGREFDDVEPDLRRDYEGRYGRAAADSGTGDAWQRLREEIREGWDRARGKR